jgi:hypothetical protein
MRNSRAESTGAGGAAAPPLGQIRIIGIESSGRVPGGQGGRFGDKMTQGKARAAFAPSSSAQIFSLILIAARQPARITAVSSG